jgi:serine/threonine-protein kinase
VLPFRNDGPPEDNYVADGLTDDLVDTLSMTRGLAVRPRSVVARFKATDRPGQEIGRELGVQVIVDGSVRRMGATMRVGLRLIGTADGFQLWARRLDTPITDLLGVSDDAARAIAYALTSEFPSRERGAAADPAGVELYLRARSQFRADWARTAAPAVKLFESALALAPADPNVVAGCAIALSRMIFFGEGDRDACVARAKELTERAVVLAPEHGDAWAALSSFRLHTGDAEGAARAARAGVGRAPNNVLLQDMLGRILLEAGAIDEAIVRLDIALALDPTLVSARHELVRAYALLGDWSRADTIGEPLYPRDNQRFRVALWRGVALPPCELPPATYAELMYQVGRHRSLTDEQRGFMQKRRGEALGRLRVVFDQRNAEVYAFVGDDGEALRSVCAAIDGGLIDFAWIDRCPLLTRLRGDPRWPPLRAVVEERVARIIEAVRSASLAG